MEDDNSNKLEQRRIENAITDISSNIAEVSEFVNKAIEISLTSNAMLTVVLKKLEELYISLEPENIE